MFTSTNSNCRGVLSETQFYFYSFICFGISNGKNVVSLSCHNNRTETAEHRDERQSMIESHRSYENIRSLMQLSRRHTAWRLLHCRHIRCSV